ncbi:MAG: hypothetical protein KatS3mg105_1172 [Gemmatales bacterium]|nr:MAG: hypothetical protein KatS3mg105_1172 [Gemmatales bacterium]
MTTLCLFAATFCTAANDELILRIRPAEDSRRIEVEAVLSEKRSKQLPATISQQVGERWLRLAFVDSKGEAGPPIFGKYELRKNALVFTPRFALSPGEKYRAILTVGNVTKIAEYRVPKGPQQAASQVVAIYPSADILPANQLKFYIHFSKPMREGRDIFDHFTLLDENGKPVYDPWRRTELWSADRKRLTLWIHPGRVKKGINLREEFGPVLKPNRNYTLVIGGDLVDADGQKLGKAYRKKFTTSGEKRTRPLPSTWRVTIPKVGSKEPVVLRFPDPLDRALLDRFITVHQKGQPVRGTIHVTDAETQWSFLPELPWQPSDYTISVDERLEDLAGNTPIRLFDVDLEAPAPPAPNLKLHFRPK